MPAPAFRSHEPRPEINHVNLMVDTFISNATVEDLRSISRCLLVSGPAGVLPAFLNAAHNRLAETNATAVPNKQLLFTKRSYNTGALPTEYLYEALSRARKLFGSGLGFASLGIFTAIVWGTVGLRWDETGEMTDILTLVDEDLTQAIQSCKEEIAFKRINDYVTAVKAVNELKSAISECQVDVESWGGEFPFARVSMSLEFWKIGV